MMAKRTRHLVSPASSKIAGNTKGGFVWSVVYIPRYVGPQQLGYGVYCVFSGQILLIFGFFGEFGRFRSF